MAAKEKAAEGKKQEEDEKEDQEPEHNDQSIKQGDEKDETDRNQRMWPKMPNLVTKGLKF